MTIDNVELVEIENARCPSVTRSLKITIITSNNNNYNSNLSYLTYPIFIAFTERKKQVPFRMAIENMELVQVFSRRLAHWNSKVEIRNWK